MHSDQGISIWFFIGSMLAIYGVLILGSGLYSLAVPPPESQRVALWDLHADIARGLAERVPPFDRALASLIRGLDEAGRLDRTLVAVITEFGRSPRLNRDGGRDHWPGVFSVVLAGGGIPGGRVIGSSTQDGAEPKDRPVSPAMLAALIRHKVGVGLGPLPQLI